MTSTVRIEKSVYGGDGLGRLGDGRVIFVPGALPDEQVKAEIVEDKKTYVRAKLVEIVEASPDRIGTGAPPVPGMAYANFSRKGEIAAKAAQLVDFLERSRIPFPHPPILEACGTELNYRNKVVYHFDKVQSEPMKAKGAKNKAQAAKQDVTWILGYREEHSHNVVDVAQDPLARPEINKAIPIIRQHVLSLLTQGAANVRRTIERKGNLTIRWSRSSGIKWWIGDKPPSDMVMKETACGKTFEVPADGFWQMNPDVAEELCKAVVAEFERGREVAPDVIDLYCGVGVLGLCCRPRSLAGVESGKRAVEFAKKNAEALGQKDAAFFMGQTIHFMKKLKFTPTTTVILDPPRSGLEHGVAGFLMRSRVPRIIYVSCDPATLTRDLRSLTQAFDIKSIKWFDMFPRTARFETLVVLERRPK